MGTDARFKLLLGLGMLLVASSGLQQVFAEKTVSIQETVNVSKEALTYSISSLDAYPYILPDYIKSSSIVGDSTASMKIGTKWINTDADVRFVESGGIVTLEVISGDFKGTRLDIVMDGVAGAEKTRVSAEISLQTSWHAGLAISFVPDSDIESMLYSSLNGLVEYAKNPSIPEMVEEEKFCVFSLCF